jgi:hypothetical protein
MSGFVTETMRKAIQREARDKYGMIGGHYILMIEGLLQDGEVR